jgi:hypothetical protein
MQYKTSRKEALAAGDTRYIGAPCKRGHVGLRYTGNWECMVCKKERKKDYKARNKPKLAERRKLQRQRNPEAKRAQIKRWKLKNPAKVTAQKAKRRAAKINRTPSWLRPVDLRHIQVYYEISKRQTQATGIEHHVDHIIPLQGETVSGLHVPWNLQVLEGLENLKKHNKLT